ncbi:MAG TPA: hypothetical protein VN688_00975 [Gemmataceae bacterium]|nr:hypothetical protein [Gemmataceae bacterium]
MRRRMLLVVLAGVALLPGCCWFHHYRCFKPAFEIPSEKAAGTPQDKSR